MSCPLTVSCSDPASGVASRVYMGERPVRGRARIYPAPSYQRRVCPLDAVDGILDHFGICNIHAPVMIQVVHLPIAVVIDEDVIGIPIHMTAQGRAPPRVAASGVVLRGSESAQHPDAIRVDPVLLQVLQDELV